MYLFGLIKSLIWKTMYFYYVEQRHVVIEISYHYEKVKAAKVRIV